MSDENEPKFENEVSGTTTDNAGAAPAEPTGGEPAQPASTEGTEGGPSPTPENTEGSTGAEPSGAEKRIHQLTAQREAERQRAEREIAQRVSIEQEAAWLKVELEEARKAPVKTVPTGTGTPPAPPTPPDPDSFEDAALYIAAEREFREKDREYITARIKFDLLQERDREIARRQADEAQTAQAQILTTFSAKVDEAAKDDPDFRYLPFFSDTSYPISGNLLGEVMQSESPAEIIRFLSDNRTEAAKLSALPPNRIARELGKIEAKLTVKPTTTNKVSNAPEPINTVGGTSGNITGEVSDAQYFAQEAAKYKR